MDSNKSRSLRKLLNTCNSEATKENYLQRMNMFNRHIGQELDEFVTFDNKKIEETIEDFIMDIKNKYSPNSIPTMLYPVKSFLEMNDILINWKKLYRFYPEKVKVSGQSAWSTQDVQKIVSLSRKISSTAIIHMLASSGCRVGGLVGLKIRDVTNKEHGCKMLNVYAGDKEEYKTFLTPEASIAYEDHIKYRMDKGDNISSDSYVFENKHGGQMYTKQIYMIVKLIALHANVRGVIVTGGNTKGGRYGTQLLHGFRKRFNTILKLNNEVNDNSIEKMMGHKNGLDGTYLQIPDDKLFENFMKGAIDLTVSDEHRLRLEKVELEKEKHELVNVLKARLEKLEKGRNVIVRKFVDIPKEDLQDV